MSTAGQASRGVIERYVDIHRTGETSKLAEIIAPEFRYRVGPPVGVEGVAAGVRVLHAGFTEITCAIEQCIAEDDWAAFRFVIAGTHTGVFSGRAPTGKRITWGGADFARFREGKLVELWAVQESLPLLEGIGAVTRVG
jgi:predicted ester cyclase